MLRMRNYLLMMLLSGGMIFSLASCNDDDDGGGEPVIGEPTISVDPATVSDVPGATVEFTITAEAASGATVASVTANGDAVSGGTYSYTIADDAEVGSTIEIEFVVTDDQDPAKTATTSATVTVSEEAGQEIAVTGSISESTTWTANNTYLLDGLVFVEEGATLTIEPGTLIKTKAKADQADDATALIITRGAKIEAVGTAEAPIVFTADSEDELNPDTDNGHWGGLIILGRANVYSEGATELQIEGIPTEESRARYGGDNDQDDSGTLQYVSIRFTGAALSPGNEIQGLTLGAVGSETTIDHIEVFGSSDDGIEFFGGTVTVTHAAVAFAEDDSFDWDQGFRGKGQFWFSIQKEDAADHAIEADGAEPTGHERYANPTIYNATFIGSGASSSLDQIGILLRDATAGNIANSIIADFPNALLEVQDIPAAEGVDSYQRMIDGQLILAGNIFHSGSRTALDATETGILRATENGDYSPNASELSTHLTDNNNVVADPALTGISRTTDGGLNPVPTAGATENLATIPEDFQEVGYKGAFDPEGTSWLAGWSFLSQKGYLAE